MNAVSTTGGPDGGWVSLHIAKGIPERLSLCYPLTIKTNPGKSALQVREHSKNKIAHRRFCTFRTSSCHACPRSTGSTLPPPSPALRHFHRPHSLFCFLVSAFLFPLPPPVSSTPLFSSAYKIVRTKDVKSLNASTIISFDKQYNSW